VVSGRLSVSGRVGASCSRRFGLKVDQGGGCVLVSASEVTVTRRRRRTGTPDGSSLTSKLSRMRRFRTTTAQAIMSVMAGSPMSRIPPRSIETRAESFNVAFARSAAERRP
jgi:hypothetical protein